MYQRFFKRSIDVVLALVGIVICAIPMVIIAQLVKRDSPGPALFSQRRIGIHRSEFMLYKFRSMPVSAPHDVATHQLDAEAVHMSKFQLTIRKYSLDELPQLWNILKGDMSVIGPRPALWNQFDLIEARERYGANDVKPGLTGWAQINGRDELPIDKKAELDGDYVKQLGFAFDCKCFFGTILKVLKHEGVQEGAHMP